MEEIIPEMKYEEKDMFKVSEGDWLVVVESDEVNNSYEVAEKRGSEVVYFSSEDLEELVKEGTLEEYGKMDEASFAGVKNNSKVADISRITGMASLSNET